MPAPDPTHISLAIACSLSRESSSFTFLHIDDNVADSELLICLNMSAQTVKAAYYRGGSSKAVFLLEDDIPPPGNVRDALIKRLIGAPDPLQIDGMGGSRVVSSKVAIIRKSTRDEADVDYTFAQIGITDGVVRYDNNCGNISSAVGPFAITAGLVDKFRSGAPSLGHKDTQEVRIYNTGTKKLLVAHVPVDSKTGGVVEEGDFSIAGVPGTGAPILLDYSGVSRVIPTCSLYELPLTIPRLSVLHWARAFSQRKISQTQSSWARIKSPSRYVTLPT